MALTVQFAQREWVLKEEVEEWNLNGVGLTAYLEALHMEGLR
jgi:hypothetical protein